MGARRRQRRRTARRRSAGAARRWSTTTALPPEERARRERAREGAGGVTAFATDEAVHGRRVRARRAAVRRRADQRGGPRAASSTGRCSIHGPDPPAQRVAYVSGRALRIAELRRHELGAGRRGRPQEITWGSAEFVAAEEMGRLPRLLVEPRRARRSPPAASTSPPVADVVHRRPGQPGGRRRTPCATRRPARTNADVTLHVLVLDGSSTEVAWDHDAFPYLADVRWAVAEPPAAHRAVARPAPAAGARRRPVGRAPPNRSFTDEDEAWVELVPGTPGRARRRPARDGRRPRRCPPALVDGEPVTPDRPAGARRRRRRRRHASRSPPTRSTTPPCVDVWRWDGGGLDAADRRRRACTAPPSAAPTTVLRRRDARPSRARRTALVDGPTLASLAETPLVDRRTSRCCTARRAPAGHRRAAPPRPRRLAAAGAARPVRRPARPARRRRAQRLPHVAVVRRPGLRRGRRRRARHAGPRAGVGARRPPRPRRPRCSTTRSTRCTRSPPSHPARPRPRRHPRLELRRLPRRARRAAPPRRVPRRDRRRAGHRVAAVRHALHRALPRRPEHRRPTSTTRIVAAPAAPATSPGRCC